MNVNRRTVKQQELVWTNRGVLAYAVLACQFGLAQRRWVQTCGLSVPFFSNGRSHRVEQSFASVVAIAKRLQDANTVRK